MPTTPFMGVRISWLILARKADLACAAASARSAPLVKKPPSALVAQGFGNVAHKRDIVAIGHTPIPQAHAHPVGELQFPRGNMLAAHRASMMSTRFSGSSPL